jgi:O-antigen ligase
MAKSQSIKTVSIPNDAAWSETHSPRRTETGRARIFLVLLAIVALAPLPLGSARPLAWEILGLAVAALLIVALASGTWDEEGLPRDLAVPMTLFFLVLGYAVLQCVPLPGHWSNPIWALAGEGLGQDIRGSIAVDPALALIYVFRLLTYAGVFVLACLLCRDRNRAQAAIVTLSVVAAVYAVYGLFNFWTGNATFLQMPKGDYYSGVSATFVNHNSFATYAGLALVSCLAGLIGIAEASSGAGSRRHRLSTLVEQLGASAGKLAILFVLATALLLTGSRGGLLATLLGTVTLLGALYAAPSVRRWHYLAWAAVPLALLVVALVLSGDETLGRFAAMDISDVTDAGGASRPEIFTIALQALKDFSWQGTGLGSFGAIFQIYRSGSVQGFVDMAHDDYLQNMLELGVPAALCLFAAVAWLAGLCLRGIWRRNRDVIFPALGLAATVLVASHAFVDFSLQIPAVTVSYMLLLGVGVAQSRSPANGSAG